MYKSLIAGLACALACFAQDPASPIAKPARGTKVASGFDLKAMDKSADPCVDFYQYACGTWLANNPVPSDQSSWGRFSELEDRNRETLRAILEKASGEKVGDFYAACMDEAGINQKGTAPLKPELDRIASITSKAGLTDELVRLHKMGVNAFFGFSSTPDAKDSAHVIAYIDQGGLGLPDRDYYLKSDAKSVELRRQYVEHVAKMLQLLGDAAEIAAAKAKTIMAVETELATGSLDVVERRDPQKTYHKLSVKELVSLSPGLQWPKYFEGLGLPQLESLDVAVPPFFRQVESVVVQHSLDDLKIYLTWHLVNDTAASLPTGFVDENFNFFGKTLNGSKELRPRWKRCVDVVDGQLGDALGQKFVEQTFGAEGKARTLEMVKAIENALEQDIAHVDWMTAATRKQALIKLHGITNKIGYPDKWKDYSSVQISKDDAFGDSARANEFEFQREVSKVGKPVDKREWGMTPPTVNAYYNPQTNDINFPAGILQPPFYENSLDDAVNFGAIGAVIGHELTHGFDDQGRQFDADGNLRDWWTAADAKAFEQRADCLVKEYGGFTAVDDIKLNGKLTLGENTADNGGLRIALAALLTKHKTGKLIDGLTPEQRLFLGWGQIWCTNRTDESARLRANVDPHSPGKNRVNGVVSNMPEFQKAFACKVGQPMVRYPACRVW